MIDDRLQRRHVPTKDAQSIWFDYAAAQIFYDSFENVFDLCVEFGNWQQGEERFENEEEARDDMELMAPSDKRAIQEATQKDLFITHEVHASINAPHIMPFQLPKLDDVIKNRYGVDCNEHCNPPTLYIIAKDGHYNMWEEDAIAIGHPGQEAEQGCLETHMRSILDCKFINIYTSRG